MTACACAPAPDLCLTSGTRHRSSGLLEFIWDFEAAEHRRRFTHRLLSAEWDGTWERGWAPARARCDVPKEGGRNLGKAGGFLTFLIFSNVLNEDS